MTAFVTQPGFLRIFGAQLSYCTPDDGEGPGEVYLVAPGLMAELSERHLTDAIANLTEARDRAYPKETQMKFRKKPVVIDAMQWDGTAAGGTPIIDWVLSSGGTARYSCSQPDSGPHKPEKPHTLVIDTLEGSMHATSGDYIIRGVQGEFYPCKPDIFAATYDRVES